MRTATLLTVSLLTALMALPTKAPAQVSANITIGIRTGTAISVALYSPEQQGQWQQTYTTWTPVTLYVYNGVYYREQPRDRHNRGVGRPVSMYHGRNGYFMAPTGQEWANRGRGHARGRGRH